MKKRKNLVQVISFLCCAALVIGIVVVKMREYAENNGESIEQSKEIQEEKTTSHDSKTDIESQSKKKKAIKVHVKEERLGLKEENEDCGIFFVLKSVKCKKKNKDTICYILECKVKNDRKGEVVNLEKFSQHFSVEVEKNVMKTTLLSGKKTIKYGESTEVKMIAEFKKDIQKNATSYRVFYTTDPEKDEDQMIQFRTEYVLEK